MLLALASLLRLARAFRAVPITITVAWLFLEVFYIPDFEESAQHGAVPTTIMKYLHLQLPGYFEDYQFLILRTLHSSSQTISTWV